MDDWPDPGRPLRILVVEDDLEIASVLQRMLRAAGLDARAAYDGPAALDDVRTFKPDVVLLDLGLPGIDGVEIARRLRIEGNDVPIIAVTARDAPESRVEGLDAGADDYVLKPFNRDELLARIRATLRRRPPRGAAALTVKQLTLDPDARLADLNGRVLDLTSREFELLEFLMRNRGIVISRQQLLDEVWGYDPLAETNTIEVFISNLRRKLESGGEQRILETVRNAGYVIRN
ncbi:MAG: response regulator transcription factor [Actinomycetes bacterium]|nr:response regulator transcription factor [Solirubrobacterales bacterium]